MPILRAAVDASVEHLRPWMPWIRDEPLPDEARRRLIDGWEANWRAGGDVVFGAFVGGVVVGGAGLHRRGAPETLEVGYWVHVDHVRRGYATEIASILTDAAFTVDGIELVEIHHDKANIASRGIPELLGFRLHGETPDTPSAPGELGIDVCWSTNAVAWRAKRPDAES